MSSIGCRPFGFDHRLMSDPHTADCLSTCLMFDPLYFHYDKTCAHDDNITHGWNRYIGLRPASCRHYNDVIMSSVASQITDVSIVCSTIGSGVDHRKHQSSTSLAFVRWIHRWPVNSPYKRPVTRKMFPFDAVVIRSLWYRGKWYCAAYHTCVETFLCYHKKYKILLHY